MLGAFLAFVSAALFGLNNAVTRRGVLSGTSIQGMAVGVPIGGVVFLLACLAAGSLGDITSFSTLTLLSFAIAGISHFAVGRYCNYRAIAAIGTNLASPIQQWEVLVTLTLALVFLGETLTPISAIAIALLLLGPVLAARRQGEPKLAPAGAKAAGAGSGDSGLGAGECAQKPIPTPQNSLKFEPRYAEGYFWAFLSIFGYGISPIFVRAGLENASLGTSLAAGLVSYVAATIAIAVWVVAGGHLAHVKAVEAEPRRWFQLAGLLVSLSQMVRYMALTLVPVMVVAPIIRVQNLFRIYFSWVLTRDHEVFDRNVIVGTLVSMVGAVLISLPAEALAAAMPLPGWLRAGLVWHWP